MAATKEEIVTHLAAMMAAPLPDVGSMVLRAHLCKFLCVMLDIPLPGAKVEGPPAEVEAPPAEVEGPPPAEVEGPIDVTMRPGHQVEGPPPAEVEGPIDVTMPPDDPPQLPQLVASRPAGHQVEARPDRKRGR